MSEIPNDFLSTLGRDPSAALRFAGLDEGEKQAILDSVRRATSARERENIIYRI